VFVFLTPELMLTVFVPLNHQARSNSLSRRVRPLARRQSTASAMGRIGTGVRAVLRERRAGTRTTIIPSACRKRERRIVKGVASVRLKYFIVGLDTYLPLP
jgi:hypothetical protein